MFVGGGYVRAFVGFCGSCRSWLFVSLFVVVLFSSLFVGVFVARSSCGASLENAVYVKDEAELKNAINSVYFKEVIVTLCNDIVLTESLKISADTNITLTSNKAFGYYKLIGAEGKSAIFVDGGGVLRLDGVIVTHVKNAGPEGGGVYVEANGLLIMYSGEISGNDAVDWGEPHTPTAHGGGVANFGVFEIYGGKISKNSATGRGSRGGGIGGGINNRGVFTMFGGEITNNDAHVSGGGVYNSGTFTMSGGEITNNRAEYWGGGVCTYSIFERLGGVISGNTAGVSGADNVYPNDGSAGGSPSGNSGGSPNAGNGGGSGSGDGGGSSSGSGGASVGGFSLRDIVIVCVGVAVVVVGVVVAVLLFTFKKELKIHGERQKK